MAAAEAAAAREAAEAAEAARAAEAAANVSMAAAATEGWTTEGSAVDATMQAAAAPLELPQSGPAPILAAPTPVPVEAAAPAPADASMAAAATPGATPMPVGQEAPATTMQDATAAATPKPSRRPVILAWTRRLAIFAVSAALLAGGVVLGSSTFQRTRAVPTAGVATELTQPPAAVAKEFISALATADADAVRSALAAQPNKDLTDEFTKFGIKKVTGVETLGTSVDGTRSATEVLLHTISTDGSKFDINLIILVNGNQIEGFR